MDIERPFNPYLVPNKFESLWVNEFGNDTSVELLELWMMICGAFDVMCHRNQCNLPAIYHNIPAPTGSGKTQLFRFYCAELVKSESDVGVLIVTTFKREADEAAQKINEWSGLRSATSFHSTSSIQREDAYKLDAYQVVVITHECFIRNHYIDSFNKELYKSISSYNGEDRKLIIIDEEIGLINNIGISHSAIRDIESNIHSISHRLQDNKTLANELKLVSYLVDNYDFLFDTSRTSIRATMVGPKESMLNEVAESLGFTNVETRELFNLSAFIGLINDGTFYKINGLVSLEVLMRQVEDLKYLLDDGLYIHNNGNEYEYRTSTLEYPDKSLVILNATANPYSIGLPNSSTPKIPKVKTYEDVTLELIETDSRLLGKTSFSGLNNSPYESNELSSYVFDTLYLSEFDEDAKVAVFTHMDVSKKLKPQLKCEIDHFGNLVGTNKYKDCDYVFIYGIQNKPGYLYLDALYHTTGVDAFSEDSSEKRRLLKYTDMAADIVQGLNRGRCRGFIKGKAPSMHAYLFIPNNQPLTQIILSFIKDKMPGITITLGSHKYIFTKKRAKVVKQIDKDFVEAVKAIASETKAIDIKKQLAITDKVWRRILRDITLPEHRDSYLQTKLREMNCMVYKDKGSWVIKS